MDHSKTIDPDEFARMFEFEPSRSSTDARSESSRVGTKRLAMFSLHGHVLIIVAREPEASVAEIAARLQISPAVVNRILGELVDGHILHTVQINDRVHHVITGEHPMIALLTAPRSAAAVARLYGQPA